MCKRKSELSLSSYTITVQQTSSGMSLYTTKDQNSVQATCRWVVIKSHGYGGMEFQVFQHCRLLPNQAPVAPHSYKVTFYVTFVMVSMEDGL